MRHFIRNGLLAITLLGTASFAHSETAEARTSFSLSVGVPMGYYGGGGWGGGYYGHYGRHRPGYAFSGWYAPSYYRPNYYYRPGYMGPRYYSPAPVYYPRPVYRSYGPIFSLGLFPAYVGDSMSREDRDLYYTAYRRALAAPVGEGIAWNSDRAGGQITTTRDGWAGQRYCREFRQNVMIDGRSQEAYGTACQTPNGDWQLVENQ